MDYKYLLENSTDFFKDTNEYFDLRRKFQSMYVWMDMIVAPLITIISFFVYGSWDMFSIMGFAKSAMAFREWVRFRQLSAQIYKWKEIIHASGGPNIVVNDPEYHIFVYAEAMQRLHNKLFKTCCRVPRRNC
jgi:hypothetical protein